MAVKHKKTIDGENNENLNLLMRYLDDIIIEPSIKPTGQNLISLCEYLVKYLGEQNLPNEVNKIGEFMKTIKTIQEALTILSKNDDELMFLIFRHFYEIISDPVYKPGAALAIVLQLVDLHYLANVVKRFIEGCDDDICREVILVNLCTWLTSWTKTANLGKTILLYIEQLEAIKKFKMLIKVTLRFVEKFFTLLKLPAYRSAVGPVLLHMLTRIQNNPEAFHKIIPQVPKIATCLKQERSESALVYLQQIVNVCKALSDHYLGYSELYKQLEVAYKLCQPQYSCHDYLLCNSWTESEDVITSIVQIKGNDKIGLKNLGNTCYMNSVIQALFMTKVFCNEILMLEQRWPLLSKLQGLFALLLYSKRNALSPSDFCNLARPPAFFPGEQQDSSEFLGYLLDTLHDQEMSLISYNLFMETEGSGDGMLSTLVQQVFGGRAETVSKCHTCNSESKCADVFRELQLSFPTDFTENDSVQSLLDFYLKPELLCNDNQYLCEKCNGLTDAERIFRVIQPPARLIITLKRFSYDLSENQRIKLLHRVKYTDSLILANAVYELYAVVVHSGRTLDSGHYFTYARDNNIWYKFNDEYVYQSSQSELTNLFLPETPYILFYCRRDSPEPRHLLRHQLPVSAETVIKLDSAEFEAEQENKQLLLPIRSEHFTKKDDPPPPGCGGGSSIVPADRFIC